MFDCRKLLLISCKKEIKYDIITNESKIICKNAYHQKDSNYEF